MFSRIFRISLLASLMVMFFAISIAPAVSQPHKQLKDRITVPARLAPSYSFPICPSAEWTPPDKSNRIVLNTFAPSSNSAIVGYTTYDNQHNCTMGRQVEHRGSGYIHFAWMAQDHDTLGQDRGIGYQVYEEYACSHVYSPYGIRIESGYSGYTGLDADPSANAVVTAHHLIEDTYYPSAYWDLNFLGIFNRENPADIYGWGANPGIGPDNTNMWPKIEWHIGTETVLHMVCAESASERDFQTISYYRRVGPYGFDSGTWTDQRVIDSVENINPTITSSPIGDKVAIVWNAPADYKRDTPSEFDRQNENDVWYAVSTNQGADWAADTVSSHLGTSSIGHMVDLGIYEGGNITQYTPESDFKAYCALSALISTDDELHITWGCRRWTDTISVFRRQGAIFHWAENTPTIIRMVKLADWDTGGVCYAPSWGTDVDKMSISECDGKFYILFTQFGDYDVPCGDVDNVNNIVNGYLYLSVYDPAISYNWDHPQRVTDIPETPEGCIPGDMTGPGTCNSEYWASMARYGRADTCQGSSQNVLDILYINDYAPGASVFHQSGVWTLNPVMWVTTPCRDAVGGIVYHDDAGFGVGLCYGDELIYTNPTGVDSFHVTMFNLGTIVNNYTAEVYIDSSNSQTNGTNTTVDINPAGGVIDPFGPYFGWGSETLSIVYSTDDEIPFSTVYGHILITHEAVGSPRVIPFCIGIGEGPWPPMDFIIETPCKRLKVYSDGAMGGSSNASLDFTDDPDDCAEVYLYDGSPIVCHEIGGERKCFFSAFDNDFTSDDALRTTDIPEIDSTSSEYYTEFTANMITADSLIGLRVRYFAPRQEEYCQFVIKRIDFWNRTQSNLNNVAVGEVVDWDVPSFELGIQNESDFDATRNLIYQTCADCPELNDPCDSMASCERRAGIASYTNQFVFKNYLTIENDVYIYGSGPFGSEAPLPDDTIYEIMNGAYGFITAELDSCEDLSTLITFDIFDLYPDDTVCAVMILTTSKNDPSGISLQESVDSANSFIFQHDEIACVSGDICSTPGDANTDGQVNVGDAVYLINYVFRGGPAPEICPVSNGDPNGDCECNVGDAVYIINYVFRGGPPPIELGTWYDICN